MYEWVSEFVCMYVFIVGTEQSKWTDGKYEQMEKDEIVVATNARS